MADTDLRDLLRSRHPNLVVVAQFLRPEVEQAGVRREITRDFALLALALLRRLDDSPSLYAAVLQLVQARDAVIRAALADLYVDSD